MFTNATKMVRRAGAAKQATGCLPSLSALGYRAAYFQQAGRSVNIIPRTQFGIMGRTCKVRSLSGPDFKRRSKSANVQRRYQKKGRAHAGHCAGGLAQRRVY